MKFDTACTRIDQSAEYSQNIKKPAFVDGFYRLDPLSYRWAI